MVNPVLKYIHLISQSSTNSQAAHSTVLEIDLTELIKGMLIFKRVTTEITMLSRWCPCWLQYLSSAEVLIWGGLYFLPVCSTAATTWAQRQKTHLTFWGQPMWLSHSVSNWLSQRPWLQTGKPWQDTPWMNVSSQNSYEGRCLPSFTRWEDYKNVPNLFKTLKGMFL